MDEDETMEKLGAEPLVKLLRDIGGWNASESGFNVTNWSLEHTLKVLQNKYNMGGLFSWIVGEDDRNSSRHIIQIDQGGLSLPTRDNYLNKTAHAKVLAAYLDYMVKVAILLGGNNDTKPQMEAVIAFETRLAEITGKKKEEKQIIKEGIEIKIIFSKLYSTTRRASRRRTFISSNDNKRSSR